MARSVHGANASETSGRHEPFNVVYAVDENTCTAMNTHDAIAFAAKFYGGTSVSTFFCAVDENTCMAVSTHDANSVPRM